MAGIHLVGAPMDCGKRRRGCLMGPDALRVAGLAEALESLGHAVTDAGNVTPDAAPDLPEDAPKVHALGETIGWTRALARTAAEAAGMGTPIFLGGDHAISLGTVSGLARAAAEAGRPFFVLWLDAHADFHTVRSTGSGNLHGTPLAYVTGREGFDFFPPPPAPVPQENVCLIGLRSVDAAERAALAEGRAAAHDIREIDETGIAAPLRAFLSRVASAGGMLHVSLDVDFIDPEIAPAVGTTVPGGATFREAHLVMEMLHDSGLLSSLDLVELNPFLDDRGRTAQMLVDLTASAFGRRILDRPTRAHA